MKTNVGKKREKKKKKDNKNKWQNRKKNQNKTKIHKKAIIFSPFVLNYLLIIMFYIHIKMVIIIWFFFRLEILLKYTLNPNHKKKPFILFAGMALRKFPKNY